MKARSLANPVTVGFIVKKRWKEKVPEEYGSEKMKMVPHTKTVSRSYLSRDAASIFRNIAERDFKETPVAGHLEVEFFVTENIGKDDLPKGF